MNTAAVLLSGGTDSAALAVYLFEEYSKDVDRILPIFCDYEQKTGESELQAARSVTHLLQERYGNNRVGHLSCIEIGTVGPNSLTGTLYGAFPYGKAHPAYVPARDPLLVLHAASFVEHHVDVKYIALGIHATDANNHFPDCSVHVRNLLNSLLSSCLSRNDLSLYTPFLRWEKSKITSYLTEKFPAMLEITFSGYGDLFKERETT